MSLRHTVLATVLTAACVAATACVGPVEPLMDARETLGTFVTTSAYPAAGARTDDAREAVEQAYETIQETDDTLNAHAPGVSASLDEARSGAREATSVADFNSWPIAWRLLPNEVAEIIQRSTELGVADSFSPALLDVTSAYDFEGDGLVPDPDSLRFLVAAAKTFRTRQAADGLEARFDWSALREPRALQYRGTYRIRRAGLDVGGAAKGIALDRAARTLQGSPAIQSALITAGSTTVTFGEKPDGDPWRIGIEHPRQNDSVMGTIEAYGAITVSTSGDYQRYFERGAVRYHHIIDPDTGAPARGLQSLTVVGADSGLDSDILSTALFVMGAADAARYAEEHGLGLVTVDSEGQVHVVPGPDDRTWEISVDSE
jgi:thiamine biosynthesis lipoprotein ApbE